MGLVLRTGELTRGAHYLDDEGWDLGPGPDGARQTWGLVLEMAVRDGAASVHYHPWKGGEALSYVTRGAYAGTQYVLRPPPAELAADFLAVARAWAARPCRLTRWLGTGAAGAGRVVVEAEGTRSEWYAVSWAVGGAAGVELYRTSPPPTEAAAEPGAAADRAGGRR
jgi:hypothetical protein